jgi:hypothetical protein
VRRGEADGDGRHKGDGHQGSHHGYGEVVLGSPSDAAARRTDNAVIIRGAHTIPHALLLASSVDRLPAIYMMHSSELDNNKSERQASTYA